MATLKDIAKACDISVSTVSRVLNNDNTLSVSEAKKSEIIKMARELNYRTKTSNSKGYRIAIVNWYSHDQEVIDPYYYYIRKGVEQELSSSSIEYHLFFKEDNVKNLNNYDGVIAIGKFSDNEVINLENISPNLIFIDSNPNRNKYSSIEVDFESVMEKIFKSQRINEDTKVFLLIGQEKVGEEYYNDPRVIAFNKLVKLEQGTKDGNIVYGDFTLESGYDMFNELIEANPDTDVIICGNDLIAMGANKAAYKKHITVGKDLSIIGINNIPIAKYMVPSLTTVAIPQIEMGCEAVKSLISIIKGERMAKTILLPTTLKIRKSTKVNSEEVK